MKTSRALSVIFPLTAAFALGQPTANVAPAVNSTVAVAPIAPPVVSGAGNTVTTAPATSTQPTEPPVLAPAGNVEAAATARGETSVTLDVGFGIRAVPPSRVTVPVGETLRITAPNLGESIQYIWTKNGRAIEGTRGRTLVIDHVVSGDAGTYACLFSTSTTMPQSSQALILGVGPTDRLQNLSTRSEVTPAQPLTTGFVVAAGNSAGKKLILRAVGPSLSLFGVANPLRAPILRIFDASGQPYANGYVYPAVVGGPTYESDLAESLARAGAFPIPEGTRDAVVMMPFVSGSYTAHVSSGDGTSGSVLLEIYEVP